MIVLLPILLCLAVVVLLRASGAVGTGGAGRLGALVGVIAVALLALVLGAGIMGGTDRGPGPARPSTPEPVVRSASDGSVPLRAPTIELRAGREGDLPRAMAQVGDLESGSVTVVGLSGLDPGSVATVHQCPTAAVAPSACRAGLRVSVDDAGRAAVLVDLDDQLEVRGAEPVDCAGATGCSIVAFGSARLEVVTVFGGPVPPPAGLSADPAALAPGGVTTAAAHGLPPRVSASFAVCRVVGRGDADCGDPVAAGLTSATGAVSAEVTVGPGRCPRGATCVVAVMVGSGGPRAFAPLHLVGRSGATYDGTRLATGLAIAALGLLGALWLARRTDWTPVDGDPFAGVVVRSDPFADISADPAAD